jgi:hypothetical protein
MENLYVSCYQLFERMAFTNLYKEKNYEVYCLRKRLRGLVEQLRDIGFIL